MQSYESGKPDCATGRRDSVGGGVARVNYVGANVVRENNGDWWYVVGPGLDEPLMAVKRGSNATQAWLPVVSDGNGQLIAIADSAGQLSGDYTGPQYDAGIWNSSGLTAHSQSFNPRRWATPGGIDTISTFRSRQYDSATGRWLQEDPIGVAGGVNLYQYNGNDPNSFSDPFGVCPNEVGGDGKTSSYLDCPRGTKGYDMVGRAKSPLIDPVAIVAGGIAGVIEGAVGRILGVEAESVVEGASTGIRYNPRKGKHLDLTADVAADEFGNNLVRNGFKPTGTNPAVRSFVNDATRYDVYPRATSTGTPSAQRLDAGVIVSKIRLTPGGQ